MEPPAQNDVRKDRYEVQRLLQYALARLDAANAIATSARLTGKFRLHLSAARRHTRAADRCLEVSS